MLLIIDNYDSFVFNLVRYCEELGQETRTVRNDRITLEDITALNPQAILISPGPCSPVQAGISLDLIRRFSGHIPILGVCLGHQCVGAAFGARVERARVPMHGRTSLVTHSGEALFSGLPQPLQVGRYHSLSHVDHPTYGVQFHPESILSDYGHDLLANFFAIAREWRNPARV